MIAGAGGLWWLKHQSNRMLVAVSAWDADHSLLVALGVASLTGMAVLLLRTTPLMGLTLVVHLGAVAAFFIIAADGKLIHSAYRSLALLRFYGEKNNAP